MAVQRTFSIIKPDATERNLTGAINKVIEEGGLRVIAQRRIHMSRTQAERFYGVHSERPFFGELVDFMTSAPVVVQVPQLQCCHPLLPFQLLGQSSGKEAHPQLNRR